RMVHDILNNIRHELASKVAKGIGIDPPNSVTAGKVKDKAENVKDAVVGKVTAGKSIEDSPALSQERGKKADSIKSRKIAILADHGFNHKELMEVKQALTAKGAHVKLVSMFRGTVKSADGQEVEVDKSHITTGSIMFDAI